MTSPTVESYSAPTLSQIRDYLLATGWRVADQGETAVLWTIEGHRIRMPLPRHITDYDLSMAIVNLSIAESRPPHDVRESILNEAAEQLVAEGDFWDCSRDSCWPRTKRAAQWKHSLAWGQCGKAVEPLPEPATVYITRSWIAEDGEAAAGWTPVPLTLFAPWAEHLPPADQHQMLDEIAKTVPEWRPSVVAEWQRTAEQLADPIQRAVLLGANRHEDFVEAAQPGGPND